jgi:hypothetical protein
VSTMHKFYKDKPFLASINDLFEDSSFSRFCIEKYMKKYSKNRYDGGNN